MNSILRFAFIFILIYTGLGLAWVGFSPWFEDQLISCSLGFVFEREQQDIFDWLRCGTYDLIDKWAWLVILTSSGFGALALSFAFRRTAA